MEKIIEILEMMHRQKKVKEKEVVFVTDHIKPRIAKMGCALQKRNFRVILFLEKKNRDELKRVKDLSFDKVFLFQGENDIYKQCLLFSPIVYHIFSEAYVAEWAEYIISKKSVLGKVVYDQYDIYRGFSTDALDEIGKREKFCLENADGLCCRMFETQYLKHKYHYQFGGKRLLFLDYCWNRDGAMLSEKNDGSLKFVYGGRLLERPITDADRYKTELHGFEHIAKVMQNSNAYFVILPSTSCKGKKYSAYRFLTKKYKHLVIKEPMDFQNLIHYESRMDYGIDCVELEEDIETYCEQNHTFNIKAKNRYYATNKYFDYLDAGIMPIYGRKGEMFGNYLAHIGGAVWCSLEEMPDKMEELRLNRTVNKKKACKAREILSIDKQIERLITFYKCI